MNSSDRFNSLLRRPDEEIPMIARVTSTLDWAASVDTVRFPELFDWYKDAFEFWQKLQKETD